MLHGSTRIPSYDGTQLTLTQSYGVPYFGTRSKVVDYPREFTLAYSQRQRLSEKSVLRKILFINALKGMLNFLLLRIILSP